MDSGTAFLKSQIDSTVAHHRAFLDALEYLEARADDPRFSDLCARHIPYMRGHHQMLEEYQSQIGDEDHIADAMPGMLGISVRHLADAARESDYSRLVGVIVMARQAEDAFKTFREAGKMMGHRTLQEIGDIGERHHDAFVHEANRLAQHMFVERVHGIRDDDRRSHIIDVEATL